MMGLQARKEVPMSTTRLRPGVPMSPLMLAHQLLELAEIADRAGLRRSASDLVELAQSACGERPRVRATAKSFAKSAASSRDLSVSAMPVPAVLPANVTRPA
jgi:hypothetical protein